MMRALIQTLARFRGRSAAVRADQSGASAIEFAILAPILVFAFLTTVDIGLAVHQRMAIDNALRAGAEAAMADLGASKVREIVETIAKDQFTLSDPDAQDGDFQLSEATPLSVSVNRFCACPEARKTEVGCSTNSCSGSAKPYVYYRLSADKKYNAILLPKLPLDSAVQVQVR
jgi:pilus assembly protein CpaE